MTVKKIILANKNEQIFDLSDDLKKVISDGANSTKNCLIKITAIAANGRQKIDSIKMVCEQIKLDFMLIYQMSVA